jgi:heptosyltransferase-2
VSGLQNGEANRVLIVLPTWVGDVVMATPLLRAVRSGWPNADITATCRPGVQGLLDGLPFVDKVWPAGKEVSPADVRGRDFDTAILLPGAFRWAWLVFRAGIKRRIGYARDGRGLLLTHRLRPPATGPVWRRRYQPVPTLRYFLRLLDLLPLPEAGRRMELAVTPDEEVATDRLLNDAGVEGPFVLLNPGGSYGSAKLWPAAHFARLAGLLHERLGLRVAVSSAPAERPVVDELLAEATLPLADLSRHGLTLATLKATCRRASAVITNDTGARHVALAFDRPTVTLFGPTDPAWTTLDHPRERQLSIPVPCGPCQLKRCPLPMPETKKCLTGVMPEAAFDATASLLKGDAGVTSKLVP